MKAVITSINRRNHAAGESFTISVKLTLGSSEGAVNGEVSLAQFTMNNWNAEDETYFGWSLGTIKGVKISKGGSKTVTFSVNAMARSSLISSSPDEGEARAYKYGLSIDAEYADGVHTADLTNVGTILTDRLAPTIDTLTITDQTGGFDHFGVLAQNASVLDVTGAVTLDPLDTSLTATHTFKMEFEGGETQEYTSTDGAFTDLALPYTGTLNWTYTVTDSVGNNAVQTGSFEVVPYTPPEITLLTATRYSETVADDGTKSYIPDDDGEHVWFSVTAKVCKVKNTNAWTLTCAWNDQSKVVFEDDGTSAELIFANDRSIVPDVISAAERVEFTWTLADFFTSAVMRVTVDKAGAYFSVEKNGVAVGMRATGTAKDKKFEIAQDYTSHFYGETHHEGGAFGSDGMRLDRVDRCETVTLNSGWSRYSEAYEPRISRVGPLVFLDGMVTNSTAQASGFGVTITTLPEWAWPRTDVHAIHQGSGRAIWWLRVYCDTGNVTVSRYRTESGYVDAAAGRQFPLTLRWIAADAFD